jgi:hypothetical protein
MTSLTGESGWLLICNMLQSCFHSRGCGLFVKAHCKHDTLSSAQFYENRRHSFPWGKSDGRIRDCRHKIFFRVQTNIIDSQKHNNRLLVSNPCPLSPSPLWQKEQQRGRGFWQSPPSVNGPAYIPHYYYILIICFKSKLNLIKSLIILINNTYNYYFLMSNFCWLTGSTFALAHWLRAFFYRSGGASDFRLFFFWLICSR